MLKKAQVVMLPHNNINTTITKYLPNTLSLNNDRLAPHTNQHLYIISDDEIKNSDWVLFSYYRENGMLFKFIEKNEWGSSKLYNPITKKEEWYGNMFEYRKIIATTDISLNLAKTSQEFVEKYIEEYNKGNVIKDVLVEYENFTNIDCKMHIDNSATETINVIQDLKVNPKDNTITIKELKESWTREEVFSLITTFNKANVEAPNVVKWIEQNL